MLVVCLCVYAKFVLCCGLLREQKTKWNEIKQKEKINPVVYFRFNDDVRRCVCARVCERERTCVRCCYGRGMVKCFERSVAESWYCKIALLQSATVFSLSLSRSLSLSLSFNTFTHSHTSTNISHSLHFAISSIHLRAFSFVHSLFLSTPLFSTRVSLFNQSFLSLNDANV